jgi:four helix bundle suffix protein
VNQWTADFEEWTEGFFEKGGGFSERLYKARSENRRKEQKD